MRLVLVRHAEPEEDARGRCYGTLDVGLSAAGREQARDLARRLPSGYEAVYSSPRMRAVDTAACLGRPVQVDDDLRELDFGDFEGRTFDEIASSEPELYRAWMERPTTVTFPGGEGYADLKRRTLRALERIVAMHEVAVVVTHGGVIRVALAAWLGMPDEAIFRLDQSYCGVTIVDWLEGTPLLRVVNSVG